MQTRCLQALQEPGSPLQLGQGCGQLRELLKQPQGYLRIAVQKVTFTCVLFQLFPLLSVDYERYYYDNVIVP